MAVKIISEPAEEKPKPKIKIISEPKPLPHSDPGFYSRLKGHYQGEVQGGLEGMREGYGRATAPGASPWERTKGAGSAALGALRYAGSPVTAGAEAILGDPVRTAAAAAGAPEWLQQMLGDTASLGGQVAGGAGLPGMIRAAPAALRAAPGAINDAATAVGGIARQGINTVDDVAKSLVEGAAQRKAAKLADQAPSKDVLKTAGGGEFQAAKALGGDVRPEVLQGRVNGLRDRVGAQDIDLLAEKTYPNARDMLEYLERRSSDISSFSELMGLQREARAFVKRAKKAAETTGDSSDYRAAQIAMKDLDDFVKELKPEDLVDGNPEAANAALRTAKELWSRQAKMDAVEDVISKAKRMDDPVYLQQEFRKLALDDFEYQRFTPAEQKLIDEIARDSKLDRATDLIPGAAKAKRALDVRGANTNRMTRAQELLDMIARGEADQTAKAATKAAQPTVGQRIEGILRPEPPNSRNRGPQRGPTAPGRAPRNP